MTATDFDDAFNAVVNDGEVYTITRNGEPVAVMLGIAEYERLRTVSPTPPEGP